MDTAAYSLARQAGTCATVGSLFRARATILGAAPAVYYGEDVISYAALRDRVDRVSALLAAKGLKRGDRVALLSRNRPEYLEVELAAANLGIITACLNWRLSAKELTYCIELVSPRLLIAEPDLAAAAGLDDRAIPLIEIGDVFERLLGAQGEASVPIVADPEDGLVILYTSGTTGLPKGAVISHRAMIARAMVFGSELGVPADNMFVAWAPMFHMASTDHALATLMRGGAVHLIDGFQPGQIVRSVAEHRIGWLVLIPGMIDALAEALRLDAVQAQGIHVCGAMADLVPSKSIAEITGLLQAPYLNSFGSTETGLPPATRGLIPVGEKPTRLSKQQSAFCEVRLVDSADHDVPAGEPGELAIRGPTLFSGYWRADDANARDFRGGWFHMGDVFRRGKDGTLDFVDRAKYMIKSGGENIYPAEIERVLLLDKRVSEAAVVRAADTKWGEVPVAFIARRDDTVTSNDLAELCRRDLAGYKRPREFRFIAFDDFPRSTSGKVQRHELEARLSKARQ